MGIILSAITTQLISDLIEPNGTIFSAGTSTELISPDGNFTIDEVRASLDLQSSVDSGDIILSSDGDLIINVNTVGINYIAAYNGVINSDVTIVGNVTASTASFGVILSGGTDLESVITASTAQNSSKIQDGLNTFTGGTILNPTVNISGGSFDNISISGSSLFNALSATTIYSGSTDLSDVFASKIHTHNISDINNLQGILDSKANLSGATFIGGVYAPTLSGGTIYSGGTDLEDVIISLIPTGGTSDITRVQDGLNTFTGGTDNNPTVNISGGSFDNISVSGDSLFNILSATTIYSGGTYLEDIIDSIIDESLSGLSTSYFDAYDGVGGTTTTSTAWVATVPLNEERKTDLNFSHDVIVDSDEVTINSDFTYLVLGRVSIKGTGSTSRTQAECRLEINTGSTWQEVDGTLSEMYIRQTGFGATGSFFVSLDLKEGYKLRIGFRRGQGGGTLQLQANGSSLNIVKIQGPRGLKGDSGSLETQNFTDLYITGTTYSDVFSGNTTEAVFFGESLDVSNIYSGGTNLNNVFASKIHTHNISDINNLQGALNSKANLSGATFTGGVYAPTLSGGTIYSGGTNLNSVFLNKYDTVLSNLNDVSFTGSPVTDDIFYYNGSGWTSINISTLTTVSVPSVEIYILNNATNTIISAADTPVQIASNNYNVDFITDFSHAAGVVTYTGDTTIRLSVNTSINFTSGNNQEADFYIALDTGSGFALINSSKAPSKTQGSNETTFSNSKCLIEVSNGDMLAIFVENTSSSQNIKVTDMNWTINS